MHIFLVSRSLSRVFLWALPVLGAVFLYATNPALAQGAAPLTPESEWKISDIRDLKKPIDSYCTLTRGFTKNVVLTVARNQKNETSLAFDFQKNAFAPGKTYTVAMNAGPGARRAFEARPASPSALVITTGQDDAFYAGIRKTGKLDVSISGDIYSFNIDGLGAAMDQLSGCVNSLQTAKASSTSSQPKDANLRPGKPSQASAKASKQDLASLQEENHRLSELLAKERQSYENEAMGGKDSNALIELKEKVVLLEKENARLRDGKQPETTDKKNDDLTKAVSPQTQALAEDLATLRAENARLRKALADEKTAKVAVPEGVSPQAFAALRQQYEEQKRENERLKKDMDSARVTAANTPVPSASALTQNRILEEKLAAAEKRVASLNEETSALRTEKEKLLLKKSGDNWDAEEATRRYNEADREARRLSMLLDEKTSVCNEEKAKLEGLLFDPAVTSSAQIAHLADLEEKLQKTTNDLRSSDATCQGKIAQAEKQAGGAQIDALKKQVSSLETEKDALKATLKNSSEELAQKTASAEEAQFGRSDLEKKIRDLETEIKKSREASSSELASNQKGFEIKLQETERKVREQEAAISLLQKEKTQLESSLRKSHVSSSSDLAASEKALATIRAESERKAREQEMAIATLQKEKTDLSVRLSAAEKAALERDASRTALENGKIQSLASDLESFKTQSKVSENNLRETIARLETEKSGLAKQLQMAQANNAALTAQSATQAADKVRETKALQEVEALRAEIAKRDLVNKQQGDVAKFEMEKKITALESEKKALQFALSQIGSAGGPLPTPEISRRENASPTSVAPDVAPRPTPRAPLQPDRAAIPASFPGNPLGLPESRRIPFMNLSNVTALLKSANLSVTSAVESVTPAMETTARAFRWESGPLFGSLEERPMTAREQFTDFVSDYLDRTRSHCTGDFASSSTPVNAPEGIDQAAAYEIACVSAAGGSSAAVLFAARNGVFSVIANESGAESIDTAIEARDRIYTALASVGR